MSIKALVVEVSCPKIAHQPGTWEVTVIVPKRKGNFILRQRKNVFTTFLPAIGDWIDVTIL